METYYIVGLGNAGERYRSTRHNVGFMTVDILREIWGFEDWKFDDAKRALISEGEFSNRRIVLFKPDSFMNTSGVSVGRLRKDGMMPDKLIIVHDEIDLPLGLVKFVHGRGSGGHRGVESVMKTLETKSFFRFRVGVSPVSDSGEINRPRGKERVHVFILGKLSDHEKEEIKKAGIRIGKYIETFLKDGFERTVSSFKG